MAAPPLDVVDIGRIFWLRTDKLNSYGTCPVSLRLTLAGHRPVEVSTGVRCRPADWLGPGKNGPLKKSHPEFASDSHTLDTLRQNVKIAAKRLEALQELVTPATVAALLRRPDAVASDKNPCLLAYMEQELEAHYKLGNRATYESKRGIVRKLREWHGATRLEPRQLTPERVQQFYRSLLVAKARGGEVATANKVVRHLSGLFVRGAKRGFWVGQANPFSYLDKQPEVRKKKPRLTADEQRAVLALPLEPTEWLWRARAAWALQYYLRGERIGACLLLRWNQVRDGGRVIEYQAQKHGPHKRVRVPAELAALLAELAAQQPPRAVFVLPYLPADYDKLDGEHQLQVVKSSTALINKALKKVMQQAGIGKLISTHAARRTFATLAYKAVGIAATQKFLGHTTEAMTQQYLDSMDTDELDEAADEVFGAL